MSEELSKPQQEPPTETPVVRVEKRRLWCSEQLLSRYQDEDLAEVFVEGLESIRRRRVLDFMVAPGRVSAKHQDENGRLLKIDLVVKQFDEGQWRKIFSALSDRAVILAMLLSGELPAEVDEVLSPSGLSLSFRASDDVTIVVNGQSQSRPDRYVAAVLLKLCEKLDEDPFALFLLRGRGRDEVKLELRRERSSAAARTSAEIPESSADDVALETAEAPILSADINRFWSTGESLQGLEFSIRADELPAALLKRLDPLPLGGLEDEVDFLLEEAYAQVTRRAQVYGLSMK